MKGLINPPAIYFYREFLDFLKSINGLAALVESETDLSLDSGALFLLTNKQRDKLVEQQVTGVSCIHIIAYRISSRAIA
ncbi:IS66 family insertion sequence element accessory protein TnpB [Photobacterium lutimaris]|uniref:Uncharacterized protein n=1 Tax=Photobacterium lutimaris TaxID=388278 RepID=A0A2T3J1F9_9GAMM|nr:IS66 family insertion sequence element accessory protein TnpB [Photobacterium lutimaris]PSU34915.1 hypothetical protein C9I99_07525 [Photobacterium lutimaris]TDR77264.1 IS66 Orf2 like protein [Photobacterium lutimaris]